MKSFKQFMIETADIIKMPKRPTEKNDPEVIRDFSHEAVRQIKNFGMHHHEKIEDNDPEPPKAMPEDFFKRHGIPRNISASHAEKQPEVVAGWLNKLHNHPHGIHIAKFYNMEPMSEDSIDRADKD